MKHKKTLQELDLLDRFLFSEVMEDNRTLEDVLEIILGHPVPLKDKVQAEKELRRTPLNKSVYFDVYGEDYNKLKDAYIIMIMPFDLFGQGKYKYTFHMTCDEIPGLRLQDGATRIFLNTRGTDAEGVSEELIQLLKYFENTTKETVAGSQSEKIKQLEKRVEKMKASEESCRRNTVCPRHVSYRETGTPARPLELFSDMYKQFGTAFFASAESRAWLWECFLPRACRIDPQPDQHRRSPQ